MSAPSPGPDIQPHNASSHKPEARERSELGEILHDKELQNVLMEELPFVHAELPQAVNEEGERVRFLRGLRLWPIAEERRTKSPGDAEKVEKRNSYTSFGDNGTTASVSAYGHLLQICQYVGIGRSGFFCVDLPNIASAYVSDYRLRTLLDEAQSNAPTIGIDWKGAFGESWDFDDLPPCLEFVDDRWPRFTSPMPNQVKDQKGRKSQNQTSKTRRKTSHKFDHTPGMSQHSSFSTQYFCHDRAIFQRCTLERIPRTPEAFQLSQLKLKADLLIRNLDFTDSLDFNESSRDTEESSESEHSGDADDESGSTYTFQLGLEEKSIIIVHRITQRSSKEMGIEQADCPKGVRLTITPYINGQLQSLNLEGEAVAIRLNEEVQHQIKEFGMLDVVLTYRLSFEEQKAYKPTDLDVMVSKFTKGGEGSYQKIMFSTAPDLDFIIRRNLEHILSVCSIPLTSFTSTPTDGEQMGSTDDDGGGAPIALTSGDISGHRVGLLASFYALELLREMNQYLKTQRGSYASTLRKRVQTTCERHIRWVLESTEIPEEASQLEQSAAFSPNYWATGRVIPQSRYLPGPSPADTALQILKLFDNGISRSTLYSDARKIDRLPKKSMETLHKRATAWLQGLDQSDERKRYAFARTSSTDTTTKFHLVDHVWIAQVLQRLKMCRELGVIDMQKELKRFDPEVFAKNVLKRFITENPISKQRMIATSRTASQTRFLLHSKDTALFHAMDSGLFSKERSKSDDKNDSWKYLMDEWKNTIECQVEHEDTQDLNWRKPLWYALSFILASKERQINRMSPGVLLSTTGKKLLGMYSASGMFPGFLTSNQVPMEFDREMHRDSYWQTTFEIPYILWKYGKDRVTDITSVKGLRSSSSTQASQDIDNAKKKSGFMMKKMQFANSNKLIDPRGLVEISDDWLQQGPEALRFGSDPGFLQFQDPDGSNPVIKQADDFPSRSEEVVSAGWDSYHSRVEGKKNAHSFTDEKGEKGLIVDVPRRREWNMGRSRPFLLPFLESTEGNGLNKRLQDNKTLMEHLGQPRDVQLAKKRLIWLPKADKETAMVCCLASPADEQYELSAFFDRHALYDKYFSDDTSATLNEWKTEFQLSFYRLAGFTNLNDFRGQEGIPKFSYVVPQSENSRRRELNGEENAALTTGIVRATIGFRFVGDFFDRYWTCHFLEYLPGDSPPKTKQNENTTQEGAGADGSGTEDAPMRSRTESNDVESTAENNAGPAKTLKERLSSLKYIREYLEDPHTRKKKYPWEQRKVLELLLLDQILLHIEEETKDIFDWARGSVLKASENTEGGGSKYSTEEAQRSVLGLQGFSENGQAYKMAASDPLNPLSEAIDSAYQFVELGDSEGYFNLIGRWRLFEEILQALGEDLNENLERIEEWNSRERDREPESPRWTRNDERLYRNTLIKLRIQNQRKIRDLERLNVSIQAFRDSLTGRLESIREDMSFRGSENMSLFTYVTVIFLPLGFSTGIFSMSTAPGRLTLAFMIATALTSLSVTVFALANAKALSKNIVEPLIELIRNLGKPVMILVLYTLYSCLFVVYTVGVVFRPLFRLMYDHTLKPILLFLGTEEHLERYKKRLYPIREFDFMKIISRWTKKERRDDPERQEGSRVAVTEVAGPRS